MENTRRAVNEVRIKRRKMASHCSGTYPSREEGMKLWMANEVEMNCAMQGGRSQEGKGN